MEHNDRSRNLGLGTSGSGGTTRGDSLGGGMAGSANTPTFGEGGSGAPGMSGSGAFESEPRRTPEPEQGSRLQEGKELVSERMEGMRNRVEEQLDTGMRTAADRMEGIAQRLDDVADARMSGEGVRGRAGDVAHKVADRIEDTAGYLRRSDARALLGGLENQVRERPLEMLLAGVATGWLIGKILR
jgi:ElaB/YqjD/DUF883 family membrane-anchored ribosome-binding protein